MTGTAKGSTVHRPDGESLYRLGSRVFAGTALALVLLGGVGTWAAMAQLNGAVVAQGVVAVDQDLKRIQHRDGGIIRAIAVREGDRVEAGQLIVSLEDAQTRAELSIVQNQLRELSVRRARLLAERDGMDAVVLPETAALSAPGMREVVNGELRLFNGKRANRDNHKQQLGLGIDQIGDEIRGLEAQRLAKADESALIEEEYQKVRQLAERGLVEGARVYAAGRDRTRIQGEIGEIDAAIARARTRVSEIRVQIFAIDETERTEAQKELSAVETRLAELGEREVAISDRLARTDIRAPIAGIINELSVQTIGGVITPAEVVATIVPDNARLKIAVKFDPNTIDQVRSGLPARLRFPAFNQRTTPELNGDVSYVAAATARDDASGAPYFQGDIDVAARELDKLDGQTLIPGMPVEVFVATEERSAMSYMLKPITDQFNKAFRER